MLKLKTCENCLEWKNRTKEYNGIYGQCCLHKQFVSSKFICNSYKKKKEGNS